MHLHAASDSKSHGRTTLGVPHLTLDDFHTAFLECNTTFKILNLKMLLPPYEQKKALELTDGDEWLHMLREFLRKTDELYDDQQEVCDCILVVCACTCMYMHAYNAYAMTHHAWHARDRLFMATFTS